MVTFKDCELKKVRQREDRNFGTEFVLSDKKETKVYSIKVDESLKRVMQRLTEQLQEDEERDGIYLTRGMTNIDINTKGNIWDINEEDFVYYRFNKSDVENIIKAS